MKHLRNTLLVVGLSLWIFTSVKGQIPAGYYDPAAGLTGMTLKTALYNIIDGHSPISYDDLYVAYASTDAKAGNVVWDMYSDIPSGTPSYIYHHTGSDQCGSYNSEADCYNREHSVPASWFNNGTPMYSDLFIVYPTDGYVNNRRSNYPFGEVSSASWTSSNGSKVGNCSFPGYTGTVFEPIDEYKGDFARTYFYIATRYENIISGWASNTAEAANALAGNNTVCFLSWHLNMLYQWHIADPVSTKEIDRNNAVYIIQDNRNPYIDHPEWVAVVWNMPITTAETWTADHIGIAPNPSEKSITIDFPDSYSFSEMYITDVAGRVLSGYQGLNNHETIDISGLESGMYFMMFTSPEHRLCKRFIKN